MKEQKHITITVIILHGHPKGMLIKSLESVFKSTHKSLKIAVIDNGSKDESLGLIKKNFSSVQILSSSKNLGIASGRNLGLSRLLDTETDYFFLMDSDIILHEECLEELLKVMTSDSRIGITAPVIFKEDGRFLSLGGRYIKFMSQPFLLGYGKKNSKKRINFFKKETDYVTGAISLIRKDVFKKAGIFDSRFDPYGFEDIDWSIRVKKAGYNILIAGKAFATHKGEFSFFNQTPEKLYETTKKRFFLARKHLPNLLFFLVFLPFFFLRGVLLTTIIYLFKGKLNLIRATAKGMAHGFGKF